MKTLMQHFNTFTDHKMVDRATNCTLRFPSSWCTQWHKSQPHCPLHSRFKHKSSHECQIYRTHSSGYRAHSPGYRTHSPRYRHIALDTGVPYNSVVKWNSRCHGYQTGTISSRIHHSLAQDEETIATTWTNIISDLTYSSQSEYHTNNQ